MNDRPITLDIHQAADRLRCVGSAGCLIDRRPRRLIGRHAPVAPRYGVVSCDCLNWRFK